MQQMLRKIRSLYFEGLTEVAGINKQIMMPSMCQSNYKPFDDTMGDNCNVARMIQECREEVSKYVKLEDEDMPFCKIGALKEGSTLTSVGTKQNSLMYLYRGELSLFNYSTTECRVTTMKKEINEENNKKYVKFQNTFNPMFYSKRGSTLGTWSLITGSTNYYSSMVPLGQKAIVFEIPGRIVKKCWSREPMTLLATTKSLLKRWSSFAKKIDYCVQFQFVAPGKVINRRGDQKIATYLVLSGRLRYKVKLFTWTI
jgi:hypothetical protein